MKDEMVQGIKEREMNSEKECKHYEYCEAPICPLRTREENIHQCWFGFDDVCRKGGDVPFWVRQQRKIAHQIKRRNENTVFELVMLEAPLEITRHVKGLIPWDEGICVNCKMKIWFEENRIPVPEEVRNGC
jgi:hypothetical protein